MRTPRDCSEESKPMSASTLEREDLCPASVALPQVVEIGDEESRDRGRAIHAFVRAVIAGVPRDVALADVPDDAWRATCTGVDFDELVGGLRDVRAEVAYAIDARDRSARFIGVNVDRDYGFITNWETAGTNDYEGVDRVDTLETVEDLKTGQNVTPCRENAQLGFHALARAKVAKVSRVRARIRYLGASGAVRYTDEHVFGPFDLDDVADRLLFIRQRVEEAKRRLRDGEIPTVYPGDHCRYCPALQACPAHVSLVRATARATHLGPIPLDKTMSIEDVMPFVAALSAAEKALAWDLANRGLTAFETIKESLKLIARQEPIELASGKTVALGKEFTVEHFSPSAAIALLKVKGATDAEIKKLYRPTPQRQVRERGSSKGKAHLKVVA